MSCSNGEQHVNRGEDESRRNLENFNTVTQSMKTIHRTARPSNQAAYTLISVVQTLSSWRVAISAAFTLNYTERSGESPDGIPVPGPRC